ncbi:prostate androgen-regulated mucin-like protein 1 [Python bivittatus]|uniref:Prostate androgen-regulated mucin-like protein 1 n=1 Tax=Python bivittatus TaxID=176946 RepID=A0A9F2R0G4_PYTBI|nr:prostate androgen-regulated mucin-like protein 1 [Python bivittatus]
MSPQGGRAPSVLCLIVIAAGLNIYSISSMSTSTTSNIVSPVRVNLIGHNLTFDSSTATDATKAATRPDTLSLTTTLGPVETNMGMLSMGIVPSNTPDTAASTTNLLSQPSTGLQSTEYISTSVMSVDTSATTSISPAETLATATSSIMSVSSTISSSSAPEEHTSAGVTHLSSIEVSTVPVTSKEHPTEGTSSGDTSNPLTTSSPVGLTSPQGTLASKATIETSPVGSTTFSSGVTMQEVQRALSSGSIAAITITVIAVVLLVFGIAAFLKIRHSSYGRLFDDHDYGSWGNYNNPLYDDS